MCVWEISETDLQIPILLKKSHNINASLLLLKHLLFTTTIFPGYERIQSNYLIPINKFNKQLKQHSTVSRWIRLNIKTSWYIFLCTNFLKHRTLPSLQAQWIKEHLKSLSGNPSLVIPLVDYWELKPVFKALLWKTVYVFMLCISLTVVNAVIDELIGMWAPLNNMKSEERSSVYSMHYLNDLLNFC